MSTAAILRSQMQPLGRGVRAYFAPVDRVNGTPTIFDPSVQSGFDVDAPPAPWIDLGWVENFRRSALTSVSTVRVGEDAAVATQFRSSLDAKVECEFQEWGKLQMALAGGSVHYNVLAGAVDAASPTGGASNAGAALLDGSTKSQLLLASEDLKSFAAGDLVAVDLDYNGEAGFLGTGIAAVYVAANDGVFRPQDFLRRATLNVARVQQKTATALVLASALAGGDPQVGASVQKVVAFVDREGGSFFQEWSALFVMPEDSGGRICFYYPRLQVMCGAAENEKEVSAPIVGRTLKAAFRALAMRDPIDGEMVVCWRSYFPAGSAAV